MNTFPGIARAAKFEQRLCKGCNAMARVHAVHGWKAGTPLTLMAFAFSTQGLTADFRNVPQIPAVTVEKHGT